jgi:hypothetical protein
LKFDHIVILIEQSLTSSQSKRHDQGPVLLTANARSGGRLITGGNALLANNSNNFEPSIKHGIRDKI